MSCHVLYCITRRYILDGDREELQQIRHELTDLRMKSNFQREWGREKDGQVDGRRQDRGGGKGGGSGSEDYGQHHEGIWRYQAPTRPSQSQGNDTFVKKLQSLHNELLNDPTTVYHPDDPTIIEIERSISKAQAKDIEASHLFGLREAKGNSSTNRT